MITLETPLSAIHGIGQKFLVKLKKMGITSVRDLLWHFPTRYEDFSQIYKIADLIPNQEATIQGVVEEVSGRRAWRRNLYVTEVVIRDDSGSIRAVWFNQPYIKNTLQPGRVANFSGKVSGKEDIYLSNPTYELVKEAHETRHTARIVPVYPETKGLTSKGIRYLIKPVLDHLPELEDPLPRAMLSREHLPDVNHALHDIHFPLELPEALRAKERFAFEDLFFLQLFNVKQKLTLAEQSAPSFPTDLPFIKDLLEHLPFSLTFSQKRSLWEILKDTAHPTPMNRLLQGDVGSGKTVVVAIAALHTAHHGYQTALMAPTEILARQHYETFKKFFGEFEGGVALVTGHDARVFYGNNLEAPRKKKELLKEVKDGTVKIVVGTHALIQSDITFRSLGFIIVDEQHRFGVEQRAALVKKKEAIPHFLSMSATPIPRTLSLTLFGDLELSLITELPKDRKPIITKTVVQKERAATYEFVRKQVKTGRQVFVICPRIEPRQADPDAPERFSFRELQQLDVKSVTEEHEKLSKKVFPDLRVAMLHGKMPSKGGSASGGKATKEKVMEDFMNHKTDILVSTSVVEVGVDIQNATIMIIEGADRFGLAQLYQFRGRVGRGAHQSYCFLFTDSGSETARARLKAIVEAKNGLELAEQDLRQRGPGEFFGNSQTGIPDLAMKALRHPELVKEAREGAVRILKEDPKLKKYPLLAKRLTEFQTQVHRE